MFLQGSKKPAAMALGFAGEGVEEKGGITMHRLGREEEGRRRGTWAGAAGHRRGQGRGWGRGRQRRRRRRDASVGRGKAGGRGRRPAPRART